MTGTVSKLDSASRSGKMTLADGSIGNVMVQIGPTLRGTLLRDGYRDASYQTLTTSAVWRIQQKY